MLHDIGVAGMLHDMGKLFIPEEILCKPGKLDDDEMALMRQHPVRGAEYLYGIHNIPPLAVSTAYEHHIDFGGGGYPRVPADWSLNLCSYLTSISDIFDALRTKRSYQLPTELSECKKILLKLSGTKLHPALTRHFLTLVDSVALKIPAASRS
jgi:HD-GYP domain-containing protein (c-di-GMP phosphodiesterase class II)